MTSYQENWNGTVVMAYDEGFPLLMPRWGYVVSAFVLFLIGFFGFFLNLMVILLMFKDRQLWTPLNIILFNLVCSDFSVSVLGNPFTLVSALFHRWVFGHTMCVLYGFFMALLGIASITTLTVLSFERYMLVTRPLSSRHLTSKGAALSILFIWAYSLALTTPPLMGWGNYVSEAANISCSVNWHEQSMNTLTYILFLFAMGQIVPLIVITFSYVNIVRTMKKNSQRLGRVSRAEDKVTAMVFVMIISFTIAWTPYSVFALMEQFATEGIVSPGAGVIPALVAKSSICYDPLIYVGMNTQFRQSIKRLFGVHNKGQHHSQTEKGYDNTLVSPAHKMSYANDTRYNSNSNVSVVLKKNKKALIADESSEVISNEIIRSSIRIPEMCTILENKISGAEKFGETACNEEGPKDMEKNLEAFSQSCKVIGTRRSKLKMLNLEDLDFAHFETKQNSQRRLKFKPLKLEDLNCEESVTTLHPFDKDTGEIIKNVYGNQAFEEHTTDFTNQNNGNDEQDLVLIKKNVIKHSYSLDLGTEAYENRSRKQSTETFENRQPKGLLKNTVISKFFDQDFRSGQKNFKSYLCEGDADDIGDDSNL